MGDALKQSQSGAAQAAFPGMCPVQDAVDQLAAAGTEERGAIFTRRKVVEFILDLVGYTTDRPLHSLSLLEPSFGDGDFLLVALERLIGAWQHQAPGEPAGNLASCIRAVELHRDSFEKTRTRFWRSCDAPG